MSNNSHWLVIDVGNSNTVAGIFAADSADDIARARPVVEVRYRTDTGMTADEYRAHLTQLLAVDRGHGPFERPWSRISRVIVSTVVPPLERIIRQACAPVACLFIDHLAKRDFALDLPHPEQLGADRLANVAGALQIAEPPFLLIDAGTATTFCLVDTRPAYIGGAIVPGLEISWKALQARAAKL